MGNVLKHSLLNPNQLRHYGVNVQDNPYSPIAMHISTEADAVIIPLLAKGTKIYFDSRTPTIWSGRYESWPSVILFFLNIIKCMEYYEGIRNNS